MAYRFTFLLFLTVAGLLCHGQTDTTYRVDNGLVREYCNNAKRLVGTYRNISFDMDRDERRFNEEDYQLSSYYRVYITSRGKEHVIALENQYRYIEATHSRITVIDNMNNDICVYNKRLGGEYNRTGMIDYMNFAFYRIPYYLLGADFGKWFLSAMYFVEKENITDRPYTVYKSLSETYYRNERRVDKTESYYNRETGFIDSVFYSDGHDYGTVRIGNIRFDDQTGHIDSLFNFRDPRYESYTVYYDKSNVVEASKTETDIDRVVRYPLINTEHDTVTIKEMNGYVLLNFWTFTCSVCLKQLGRYGNEKDTLGSMVFEKNGITPIAINYKSNNIEEISRVGKKYNINEIMYSGKGMDEVAPCPYQGYYYLIAPNKKDIVFEGYTLGDYTEVLKAKEEYEKNNKHIGSSDYRQ